MSKLYKSVRASDAEIRAILKREEFYLDLEEAASQINPDSTRYKKMRNRKLRARAAVRLVDESDDALSYEVETGTLASLGGVQKRKRKRKSKK